MGSTNSSYYNAPATHLESPPSSSGTVAINKPAVITYGQAECLTTTGESYIAVVQFLSLRGTEVRPYDRYGSNKQVKIGTPFVNGIYVTDGTKRLLMTPGKFAKCIIPLTSGHCSTTAPISPARLIVQSGMVDAYITREDCIRGLIPSSAPRLSPTVSLPAMDAQLPVTLWDSVC